MRKRPSHRRLRRKELGAFDTPLKIVDLMIKLTNIRDWNNVRVLEPACGYAPFSYAISKLKGSWKNIVGVEIDPMIVERIRKMFPEYDVRLGDFLLMDFKDERFDLVIGNPPYGIIGDKSHYPIHFLKDRKAIYKRLYETWRGKYNIYGLFIEKAVKLLNENGVLCFIVPATWMILDEFSKLRGFLAENGKVKVYYLGKGVFKGLNVTTTILILEKGNIGLELYDAVNLNDIKLNYETPNYSGEMITFKTKLTEYIESTAKMTIGEFFEIRISPRSIEVKGNPLLSKEKAGRLPLLTGRNLVSHGVIDYEACYTGLYIKPEDIPKFRKWFTTDRIVVGHTKGGKLVAALEDRHYAWTGDIYHLIPKRRDVDLHQIAEILNSRIMNKYMQEKYREITPHVTKAQLKILPIPDKNILKLADSIF